MTNNELTIVAAIVGIGAALYLASRSKSPQAKTQTQAAAAAAGAGGAVKVIDGSGKKSIVEAVTNNALPGQPGWGWDYYSNGAAIDPNGNYWLNGEKVWSPN